MAGRNIFISYRRVDSEGYAGRIYDRLTECFGSDRVYVDVTDISVGENFVDAIGQAIGSCLVVIVMIGPHWSTVTDEMGRRRLDDPNDFVHLEVKSALDRNIMVVPVLVHGASMPKTEELPVDLRPLAQRKPIVIRQRRFEHDIEFLISELGRYLGEDCGVAQGEAESKPTRRIPVWGWLLITLIFIIGFVCGFFWWRNRIEGQRLARQAILVATQTALAQIEASDTGTPTITPVPPTITTSPTATSPPPTITPTPTITPSPTPYPMQWEDPYGVEMILVEEGSFVMGTDDLGLWDLVARPAHMVNLGTYYIDKYEVSNAQYSRCVMDGVCELPTNPGSKTRNPYYDDPRYADYPVVYVSWYHAQTYCSWRGGRLPHEAEWEKAARGVDERSYPWGTDQPDCQRANFWPNTACEGDTISVMSLSEGISPYGIYNMSGNVAEWVRDWFQAYPGGDPRASQEFGQSYRVVRGGAYFDGPNNILVTSRKGLTPDASQSYVGFRCVVEIGSLP